MKQKMLVTGVIVAAAIACIAIIAYLGQHGSYRKLITDRAKVEKELKDVKGEWDKCKTDLGKANDEITKLKAQIENMQKAKAEEEAKAKAWEEKLNAAIVWAGKGPEHAIANQIGKNKKEANRIAVRGGYVRLGEPRDEIRIRGKGGDVSLPLITDGKGNVIGIAEHKKDKDGKFKPVITRKLAPDLKGSKFLGDIKGKSGVQPYEYIFIPRR